MIAAAEPVPTLPPPSSLTTSPAVVGARSFVAGRTGVRLDVAETRAATVGLILTAEHRNVIAAVRLDADEMGQMPSLIRTSRLTGLTAGRLAHLFPCSSALTLAYLAGVSPLAPSSR